MGLLFERTTERATGPAVQPKRHNVFYPSVRRRLRPRRSIRRTPAAVQLNHRAVSPPSGRIAPLQPAVERATTGHEKSTCRSCLGGTVVPDPDSGALVCTSCGLIQDLGAGEFVHRVDPDEEELWPSTTARSPVPQEEAAEEDKDMLGCAMVCSCWFIQNYHYVRR
jgi:hypothetical protein